jgi:hypothetical protein
MGVWSALTGSKNPSAQVKAGKVKALKKNQQTAAAKAGRGKHAI